MRNATLSMSDGTKVVVADTLESITGYVLLEQQDWFEDEIKFLRTILHPGESFIDIGANHGVYCLSLAQRILPNGKAWAFEPATSTARFLEESISANGLASVIHLEKSALSDRAGMATLALNADSEMNSVVQDDSFEGACEKIPLDTLDACMDRLQWTQIDFVKIDAEGEEANILKGGTRFFAAQSPLVMYEVKAGADYHLDLVDAFSDMGYRSYRLVPGLGILLPFDPHQELPDGSLLNLFCCKEDRANRLKTQGVLVSLEDVAVDEEGVPLQIRGSPCDFFNFAERKAYCASLIPQWKQPSPSEENAKSIIFLNSYAISQSSERPPVERFLAMKAAYEQLCVRCQQEPTHGRLASLGRVAREIGARDVAIEALNVLVKYLTTNSHPDFSEPFLPADSRFDDLSPGDSNDKWFVAGVLEALERAETYSSYYSGASRRNRLRVIADLGFASPEMLRRLQLVNARFPEPVTASGS